MASPNEKRIKHLEFIQLTVTRMAANSFFLKAWSVTLVAALFALASKDTKRTYYLIAFIPALAFWLLDAYYLHEEKLYRALYDDIRLQPENRIDFSLKTKKYEEFSNSWLRTIFTKTLLVFYGVIVAVLIVIAWRTKH
jgi:hypothetical protein